MAYEGGAAEGFAEGFIPTYAQSGARASDARERQRDRDFRASENQKDRDERERLYQRRYGNTGQEAAELQLVGGFLAELQNPESPLVQDPTARYGTLVELARTVSSPRAVTLLRQFPQIDQQLRFGQEKEQAIAGYTERLALTPDGGQSYQQELQALQLARDPASLQRAQQAIQRKQLAAVRLEQANQAKQGAATLLQGISQIPGIGPGVRSSVEAAFFMLQHGLLEPQRVVAGLEEGLNMALGGAPQGEPMQAAPEAPPRAIPGTERLLSPMRFEKETRPFARATEAQRRTVQRRMAKAMSEGGSRAALEVLLESGIELEDVPDEFFEAVKRAARKERLASEGPGERLRRYGREIFG